MNTHNAEKLTEQMKTVCIGRYLIDLPAAMDFSYSHVLVYGFRVVSIEESAEEFEARVAARELYINSKFDEQGKPSMERVTTVDANGVVGKVFRFGRTSVQGRENGKPVYYVNIALEGYVHTNGTTFTFTTDAMDPEQSAVLLRIIENLRPVSFDEIPTAPGFCFGRGMLIDPVPVEWTEGVALFAGFPGRPALALAFHTRAGLGRDPNDPGRLARNARADTEMPLWQRPLLKKLRIGHRTINGVPGEEVLERGLEHETIPVYTFDWEVLGTRDDVSAPAMHLEMSTGHPGKAGGAPVPTFLNEDSLLYLWDKISSSIRLRPVQQFAAVEPCAAPTGSELYESATAGEACPSTGWWSCAEGASGKAVYRGHLQYFQKGTRMPQALLLAQQSWWDKIRGTQASYVEEPPTTWTLADRRHTPRTAQTVSLAPPSRIPNTELAKATDVGLARIGMCLSTGNMCPTSGWWHCLDSDALDSARWFARGEILPPATFRQMPARRVRTRQVDSVFQRRSTWSLMRVDLEGPGPSR